MFSCIYLESTRGDQKTTWGSHVSPPVGSEDHTQVIRLGVKCLYPLSHLSLFLGFWDFFVVALFFFQTGLGNPGYPRTHSIDQAGLKLRDLPAPLSWLSVGITGMRHHHLTVAWIFLVLPFLILREKKSIHHGVPARLKPQWFSCLYHSGTGIIVYTTILSTISVFIFFLLICQDFWFLFMFMCVYTYMSIYVLGTAKVRWKCRIPWELKLQVVVSHTRWTLRTKLLSSEIASTHKS